MEGVYKVAATKDADSSLQERLALDSAEGWLPKDGDTLIGTIVGIKPSNGNQYGIYPIVTVATAEGNVALHCFHQTLKDPLLELRPVVGEKLAVAYMGTKESKTRKDSNGNPVKYHNYSLVVDRPVEDDATSWDMFTDDSLKDAS